MKSWLTSHYAHPWPDTIRWQIYLQYQHQHAVDGIAVGDSVFFYEYGSNKAVKGEPPRPRGRQGIVRLATVSGPIYPRDGILNYMDGSSKDWAWGVICDGDVEINGFVPRKKVLKVLKYKPGYTLRGFNHGKGVMEISAEQATELLKQFSSTARQSHPAR